jgi:hypothetical protein
MFFVNITVDGASASFCARKGHGQHTAAISANPARAENRG